MDDLGCAVSSFQDQEALGFIRAKVDLHPVGVEQLDVDEFDRVGLHVACRNALAIAFSVVRYVFKPNKKSLFVGFGRVPLLFFKAAVVS